MWMIEILHNKNRRRTNKTLKNDLINFKTNSNLGCQMQAAVKLVRRTCGSGELDWDQCIVFSDNCFEGSCNEARSLEKNFHLILMTDAIQFRKGGGEKF